MDEYIKVSGKTVEDAVLEASIQLGTTSDNIEYRIIERETKGFLGIGAKKATIEARRKVSEEDFFNEVMKEKETKSSKKSAKKGADPEKETSAKAEKKAEKKADKKAEKSDKDTQKEQKKETKSVKKDEKASDEEKKKKKDEKSAGKSAKAEKKEDKKERAQKSEKKEKAEKEVKESAKEAAQESGQPDTAQNSVEETEEKNASAPKNKETTESMPRVPADPEVVKSRAVTFLSQMLSAMGVEAEIETVYEDGVLNVELKGEDMGVLIGKRGQTLDSIQYLTSLVVNKGKAAYVRVKIDTENYRERRKATLENLAKNMAFKVKKTGRPAYLEPMNPYERRIIHSALQNDPYVTTHSEGEEPARKVVITLRKREKEESAEE